MDAMVADPEITEVGEVEWARKECGLVESALSEGRVIEQNENGLMDVATYFLPSASIAIARYSLKLLRDKCVTSSITQTAVYETGIHNTLIDMIINQGQNVRSPSSSDNVLNLDLQKLVNIALQFIFNLCSAHLGNQDQMWENYFPNGLMNVVQAVRYNRCSLSYALALLQCLMAGTGPGSFARRKQFADHKAFCCQLLQVSVKPSLSKSTANLKPEENAADSAFEWAYLIFCGLIIDGLAPTMYQNVGLGLLDKDVTPEQLIALQLVDAVAGDANIFGCKHNTAALITGAWLVRLLEMMPFDHENVSNVVHVRTAMQQEANTWIIRSLGTLFERCSRDVCKCIANDTNILEISLNLLKKYGGMAQPRLCHQENTDNNISTEAPSGRKADIVKIIANLSYQCRDSQDKIRILGGIPLILSHCNFDYTSPFLREWAIVAVRNLCEGNMDNQACVSSLERQGDVDLSIETHSERKLCVNHSSGRLEATPRDY